MFAIQNAIASAHVIHIKQDIRSIFPSLQQINQVLNEKMEAKFRSTHNDYTVARQSCAVQTNPSDLTKKTTNSATQTDDRSPSASPVVSKPSGASSAIKRTSKPSNPTKEDTHLLATVRGMRVDLAIKEKALQRLTREVDECRKTIRKLHKDNESESIPDGRRTVVGDRLHFQFVVDARIEKSAKAMLPHSDQEKSPNHLLEKIKSLELDYKALQEKRLQDVSNIYPYVHILIQQQFACKHIRFAVPFPCYAIAENAAVGP